MTCLKSACTSSVQNQRLPRLSEDSGGRLSQTPAWRSHCSSPSQAEVGTTRSPSKGPQGAIETGGDSLLCILLRSQGPIKVAERWEKATARSDVLPFKCTRNEFLTMSSHLKLPRLAENYRFHRSFKELNFTSFPYVTCQSLTSLPLSQHVGHLSGCRNITYVIYFPQR